MKDVGSISKEDFWAPLRLFILMWACGQTLLDFQAFFKERMASSSPPYSFRFGQISLDQIPLRPFKQVIPLRDLKEASWVISPPG